MDGHLVAVEVRVERGADQRMQLDRAPLYKNRLKRLNAKPVQRRCTVEHDRMILDDDLQRIPHLVFRTLDHLTGRFDVVRLIGFYQSFHNERLKQLQRHLLGQAALIELELRPDDDYGTAGIVDALSEQVLTEAALLTFEHIGERFQGAIVRARHRAAAAAVVDQGVHRLLKHTLFIAHNDVGRMQFQKPFQAVVAVNHAAVKIV